MMMFYTSLIRFITRPVILHKFVIAEIDHQHINNRLCLQLARKARRPSSEVKKWGHHRQTCRTAWWCDRPAKIRMTAV